MKKETTLQFNIPVDYAEKARNIATLLSQNNIIYKFYESPGYYPHQFIVCRTGRKWDDVMHIINSIYAPRYKKKTEIFSDDYTTVYA